ncbi:MAG: isocitrate lyase/phosphoenolpyruvate mutase family protein [Mycobacteriales bacterium]|jgi:2,3-dimethylmalate lyase
MGTRLRARRDGARRLRELLSRPEPILAASAADAASARLAEQAGFAAVSLTGTGAATARHAVAATPLPVVAPAGNGDVVRTVHGYEAAGVAGLHLADRIAGRVLPAETMEARVRVAAGARTDPEFTLVARTDADAAGGGLEAAVERAARYRDAGADVLFLAGLGSEQEIEAVALAFAGIPLLFRWTEVGTAPPVSAERLGELGYRLVVLPLPARA